MDQVSSIGFIYWINRVIESGNDTICIDFMVDLSRLIRQRLMKTQSQKTFKEIHFQSKGKNTMCIDVTVDLSRLIRQRFMIDEVERRTSRALQRGKTLD